MFGQKDPEYYMTFDLRNFRYENLKPLFQKIPEEVEYIYLTDSAVLSKTPVNLIRAINDLSFDWELIHFTEYREMERRLSYGGIKAVAIMKRAS